MTPAETFIKTAKNSSIEDALSGVSKNRILNICSEDSLRLSRFITWLGENWGSTNSYLANAITENVFYKEVLPKLCSNSLFSEQNLVVVYNAEKLKKFATEELSKRAKSFGESTLLVLVYAKSQKTGLKISALKGASLRKWISKELKAKGIEHTGKEVELLVSRFGEDLHTVQQEISKLSLLTEDKKLTTELIEEACSFSDQGSSSKLLSAVLEKNRVKVYEECKRTSAHPLQIVSYMYGSVSELLSGNRNSWKVKFLSPKAKQANVDELRTVLEKLAALDIELKSGSADPQETMVRGLI